MPRYVGEWDHGDSRGWDTGDRHLIPPPLNYVRRPLQKHNSQRKAKSPMRDRRHSLGRSYHSDNEDARAGEVPFVRPLRVEHTPSWVANHSNKHRQSPPLGARREEDVRRRVEVVEGERKKHVWDTVRAAERAEREEREEEHREPRIRERSGKVGQSPPPLERLSDKQLWEENVERAVERAEREERDERERERERRRLEERERHQPARASRARERSERAMPVSTQHYQSPPPPPGIHVSPPRHTEVREREPLRRRVSSPRPDRFTRERSRAGSPGPSLYSKAVPSPPPPPTGRRRSVSTYISPTPIHLPNPEPLLEGRGEYQLQATSYPAKDVSTFSRPGRQSPPPSQAATAQAQSSPDDPLDDLSESESTARKAKNAWRSLSKHKQSPPPSRASTSHANHTADQGTPTSADRIYSKASPSPPLSGGSQHHRTAKDPRSAPVGEIRSFPSEIHHNLPTTDHTYAQRPDSEVRRLSNAPPSPEVLYPKSGGFAALGDTLKPDDSRSETGRDGMDRFHRASGIVSELSYKTVGDARGGGYRIVTRDVKAYLQNLY
jgi:hypothetical protein